MNDKNSNEPDGNGLYNNPITSENGTVTYDCVWFGNYWQNDTNGDGIADINDSKKPIKWRVLSTAEDDLFLLSDMILDAQAFNKEYSIYPDKDIASEDLVIEGDVVKGLKDAGKNKNCIVIPEGITEINEHAFRGEKFSSVVIPSSVTQIGG